jgi:hypothetical protein
MSNEEGKVGPYEPTSADLVWAQGVLAIINDGGKWAFPQANLVYTISHTDRSLTLVNEPAALNRYQREMHHRTHQVFARFGYSVTPEDLFSK